MSNEKTLIILRGLPWTGKSTKAKSLVGENKDAVVFSTDEYWYKINFPDKPEEYSFKPTLLHQAHKWNQLRSQRAVDNGVPLIIIDNTNTTASEFCCDYVRYAHFQDYKICIEEPDSPQWEEISELLTDKRANKKALRDWAFRLEEGSKENHNVPVTAIEKMMRRWECNLVPDEVLEYCLKKHK